MWQKMVRQQLYFNGHCQLVSFPVLFLSWSSGFDAQWEFTMIALILAVASTNLPITTAESKSIIRPLTWMYATSRLVHNAYYFALVIFVETTIDLLFILSYFSHNGCICDRIFHIINADVLNFTEAVVIVCAPTGTVSKLFRLYFANLRIINILHHRPNPPPPIVITLTAA